MVEETLRTCDSSKRYLNPLQLLESRETLLLSGSRCSVHWSAPTSRLKRFGDNQQKLYPLLPVLVTSSLRPSVSTRPGSPRLGVSQPLRGRHLCRCLSCLLEGSGDSLGLYLTLTSVRPLRLFPVSTPTFPPRRSLSQRGPFRRGAGWKRPRRQP